MTSSQPDSPVPQTKQEKSPGGKEENKEPNPVQKLTNWSLRRNIRPKDEPELNEPTWARNFASINPILVNGALTILSISAGAFFSYGLWTLGIVMIFAIIACFALDSLRNNRDHELEKKSDENQRDAIFWMIRTLTDGTQGISEALHTSSKPDRVQQIAAARRAIMSIVCDQVGKSDGVRANLFEISCTDPIQLKASKYVHDGRIDHHSTRIYTQDDKSVMLALKNNEGRFEPDTAGMFDKNGNSLRYGCFAVAPVRTGDRLYGLLTVDAPRPKDIDEFDGRLMLNHFASMLALTYVKDDRARSVPLNGGSDPDDEPDRTNVPGVDTGQDEVDYPPTQ